jgi:flavodoxin I
MYIMHCSVVYFSRGGKTRKVAETIAQELGCTSVDIKTETPDLAEADMLVVGSGNYGGNTDQRLLTFIHNLSPVSGKQAAVFATAGGPKPKVIDVLQEALEAKGYDIISSFTCRGQFLLFSRGRPNNDDLDNAKVFARDLKRISGLAS